MIPIRISMPYPRVVHMDFDRIWLMATHLGRMQDHAEHPAFMNQIFSRSRMKKYYHGVGKDFNKSALGYNIPSWAFRAFWDGRFKVNQKEQRILDELNKLGLGMDAPFYVISTADGSAASTSEEALDHELCHAFYFTDPEYRHRVTQLLEEHMDVTCKVGNVLIKWGIYAPTVIDDEVQAYLATDGPGQLQERLHLTQEELVVQEPFAALLKEFKERV